jgi:hypothetical protein
VSWRIGLLIGFGSALLSLLLVAGCTGGTRAFVADQSVHITSPAPLQRVTTPFVIQWQASNRTGLDYAVFVDAPPIAPGGNLSTLQTEFCNAAPTCHLSTAFLASLGVYVTSGHSVTVSNLQPVGGMDGAVPHPVHSAIVVAVDSAGRRMSSAAWQVNFRA